MGISYARQRDALVELLLEGFPHRVNLDAEPILDAYRWQRHAISWSNHLHPKASETMLDLERRAKAGDPPTRRLDEDWRTRMEDVLWAMVNNPEFIFIP